MSTHEASHDRYSQVGCAQIGIQIGKSIQKSDRNFARRFFIRTGANFQTATSIWSVGKCQNTASHPMKDIKRLLWPKMAQGIYSRC